MVSRLPSRLSILLGAAFALAPCGWAQSAAAHRQIQSQVPIQAHALALLTIDCSANPAKVFTGGIVTIQAQGHSAQGLPMRYTFTADAGQLSTSGAVTKLSTATLAARTVHVTCAVADNAGRNATKVVDVTVMGLPHTEELHVPTPHPVPPATIVVPPPSPKPSPQPAQGIHGSSPEAAPPPHSIDHDKASLPKADGQPQTDTAKPAPVPVETAPVEPAPVSGGTPAAPPPVQEQTAAPKPATPTEAPVSAQPAPTQPAVPDVYKSSTEMEAWVNQLKQGKIEYKVPDRMLLLQAATVTVVIHGYQDVATNTLPQSTGSASLKQSPRMKVEVLAEDDPDDFTIALENGDPVKDVLSNKATTWIWKVTPNKSGARQRLKIMASLMYPSADKSEIQLQDYHTTVEVDVASVWSTIVDNYQHDPTKFFSYMIPGGAGFTFLAGLIVWWWRRKHKDEKD